MNFYNQIKQQFLDNKAYHKVKDYSKNKKDLETYYNVGKLLIEAQGGEERAKYGNSLIKEYSRKLTKELGKGYSVTQLKFMRQFYLVFQKGPRPANLSWSHYQSLLSIKDKNKRNYYINECINNNLSRDELRNKIKSNEYERLEYKDKTNIKINDKNNTIEETIKNPILIPNISNYKEIDEKRLKYLILENLDYFLKELGSGYMYVGNEYKIKIEDRYYYIDILLYNIDYNRYVVLELKAREFNSKDIGQIKLYMNYVDQNIKKITQNKTTGIIICKEKNKYILKYVKEDDIYITKYQLFSVN